MNFIKYFVLITLLGFTASVKAQSSAIDNWGINPLNAGYESPIDSVDRITGNLNVHIPLVSIPQKGNLDPIQFIFSYNSINWDLHQYLECADPFYPCGSEYYYTWTYDGPGATIKRIDTPTYGLDNTNSCDPENFICYSYYYPYLEDGYGGRHYFFNMTGEGNNMRTTDGTQYLLTADTNSITGVYNNQGTNLHASCLNSSYCSGSSNTIRDVFGNQIITLGSNQNTGWLDSFGRIIPDPTVSTGTGPCSTYWFPSATGTSPYTICQQNVPVSTSFSDPSMYYDATDGTGEALLVSSMSTPTGTYSFEYDSWGSLHKINLPRGGSIAYDWATGSGNGGRNQVRYLVSRTVSDGVTSYTWTYGGAANDGGMSKVTGQDGESVEYYRDYSSGQNFRDYIEKRIDRDRNGATLKTQETSVHSESFAATWLGAVQEDLYPISQKITWPDSNNTVTQTCFSEHQTSTACSSAVVANTETYGSIAFYDQNNPNQNGNPQPGPSWSGSIHMASVKDVLDGGEGSLGGLLQRTVTKYKWQTDKTYLDANILNTPVENDIFDASGTVVAAKTLTSYDESNGGTTGVHGLATTIKRQIAANGAYAQSSTVYNSQGKPLQQYDANGNETITSYQCGDQYPLSVTNPLLQVTQYYIDCNTGLVTGLKDVNHAGASGPSTTYRYNAANDVESIIYPDGGSTTIDYGGYTPTLTITVTKAQTGTSNQVTSTVYDGLGRLAKRTISAPEGTIYQDTGYDSHLRPYSVSNPYLATSDSTYGSTVTTYDDLDRPRTITAPDGARKTIDYAGLKTTITDEILHASSTTEDALGRLSAVVEANGASTSYLYDPLGNVVSVRQLGLSGDTARADRLFKYDQLSRLIAGYNPESGVTCYGTTPGDAVPTLDAMGSTNCSPNYDLNGNLKSKIDSRGLVHIGYLYDALNRLTQKTASDSSFTYHYAYDETSQSNGIGRLTHSWVDGASRDRHYSYDPMGRLVAETTCISNDCTHPQLMSASYDLAGNMNGFTYPDGRTISNSYDSAGRFYSIDYTSWNNNSQAIRYWSAGLANGYDSFGNPIQFAFGNGIQVGQTYDKRDRPTRISYSGASPVWSKQYSWSANGNLQNETDIVAGVQRQYSYDALSRLTSAQDIFWNVAGMGSGGSSGSSSTTGTGTTSTGSGNSGAAPQWTDPNDSNMLLEFQGLGPGWAGNYVNTSNGALAPDGSSGAVLITPSSNSTDSYFAGVVQSPVFYAGETVTGSVWLKSATSAPETINIYLTWSHSPNYTVAAYKTITLTSTWQQFQLSGQEGTALDPTNSVQFQIGGGGSVVGGTNFYAWNPRLEDSGIAGRTITNIAPYSQRLSASSWSPHLATVSENAVLAPDGTNSGAQVSAASGSQDSSLSDLIQNPAPYSGQQVTGSIWLRGISAGQQSLLALIQGGPSGSNVLNLRNITLGTSWQRFSITGTTQANLNGLALQIGGGNTFQNGQVMYAWGAQVELAGSAGPYVATGSMPVSTGIAVSNLLPHSQGPIAGSWFGYQVDWPATAVTAPDGTSTASEVGASAASTDAQIGTGVLNPVFYDGQTLTASVYLRSPQGSQTKNIYFYGELADGSTIYIGSSSANLDGNWKRIAITGTAPVGMTALALQIGGAGTWIAGQKLDVWGSQVEFGSHAGPYVPTSTLPIVANEELRNILPGSQQETGPTWITFNGATSVNSDIAPDGSGSAAQLTATANDAGILNIVPNPSLYDNQTVTASVYLRSNTPQQVLVFLIEDGENGLDTSHNQLVTLGTSWQRFEVSATLQNGLTSLLLQVGGGGSINQGQTIEIWGPQLVLGPSAAPYTPTSSTTTVYANSSQSGTLVQNGLNESYAYDSFGNMTQMGNRQRYYDATNRMVGYAYDAAGNLLADGVSMNLTWDAESRISTVNGAKYIYNAEGERVEKQGVGVTDTLYFNGQPMARYSNGQWIDFIYGPTGLIAEVQGNQDAQPTYRAVDHLGTAVGSFMPDGSFANPVDHTPFGQIFSGNTSDSYQFTGKERDTESGLDYFGARYYASSMGRFMSPDPSGLAFANPANPQSLNLYSYALNNPLINIDPTGMECVWDDGSYDAADDAQTGNAAGCSGQGGTYVNPDLFENAQLTNGQNANIQYGSWSGSANSTLASSWTTASATATANLSATPTLQDASAFYQMWLSGVGPATLNYGPNNGATRQLAQTPTAQGLRQQYIDAGCPGSASYPSGHVGPWLHGYGTLNATEMQVGGFNESMSTSGGTTTFAITNTAGQASYSGATTSQTLAALNPFNSSGTTDNPYGPSGPRHNIDQTFSWTEPNPCGH